MWTQLLKELSSHGIRRWRWPWLSLGFRDFIGSGEVLFPQDLALCLKGWGFDALGIFGDFGATLLGKTNVCERCDLSGP